MTKLDEFLEEIKTVRSKETHLTYSRLLKPFDHWLRSKNKSLNNCTHMDVYAYLAAKKHLSNQTRHMIINVVKQYFKWHRSRIKHGTTMKELQAALDDQQRCDLIVELRHPSYLKKEEDKKKKVLTVEELKKLLAMVDDEDYALAYLLPYFGTRRSELYALWKKPSAIDFEAHSIKIRTAKTYQNRELYFNDYAGKLLRDFTKIDFNSLGDFNNRLNKYSKRMGFRIHPHMFRHCFTTEMSTSIRSMPIEPELRGIILKILVGHTLTVHENYNHPSEEQLKEAMTNYHYMNDFEKKFVVTEGNDI